MKDLWERLKRFYNGQDRIDRMNREWERRTEWLKEDIELARKQARAELRDRFAMAVVSGVYIHWRTSLDKMELGCDFEDIAMMAYDVADAMLATREENNQ